MENTIVVAVDGPAGSGKSSISKQVAVNQGLKYIDSGALYRSITWFVLDKYGAITEELDYTKDLGEISIRQEFHSDSTTETFINDKNVSQLIRDEQITKNIGIISDSRQVRDLVNGILRSWAQEESILMDGRDIGSVVFPNADLKVFLDASVEIRAERRVKEYREMGKNVDENAIKNQIILRDEQDRKRPYGALVRTDDMIYIDTSEMNMNEVIEKVGNLVGQKRV
ncbi:MAG: (d)CMP kinase [bacterium]|nr:(d)CMP kinase [bacterium]